MKVAKPTNAAPPTKMESCLRDRAEKIDGSGSGRGEEGWDEAGSGMALSGEFWRNAIPLKWLLKPKKECSNLLLSISYFAIGIRTPR